MNKFLLYGVLLLIIASIGYWFATQTEKQQNPIQNSGLFPTYFKAFYSVQNNGDGTMDYYFYGQIEDVIINGGKQTLVLTSLFEPSKGERIELEMPETIPPKTRVEYVGKNFLEMKERGYERIKIRVRYNENNQPLEWELYP